MKGWNGPTPERLALAERVRVLRAEGETHRAIAARLAISRSYAAALDADPDGSQARARKDSYAGTCVDCGAATCGSFGPGKAPERCSDCAPAASAVWICDLIVARIREYADRYGRPPRAMDWNPALARQHGFDDASDRFYTDGCWPSYLTVRDYFGSFNAAIAAAGYEPRPPGHRIGMRPWPPDEIIDAIRAWAAEHGEIPTMRQWKVAAEDHPSASQVFEVIGWNAAIQAAGFTPRTASRPRAGEAAQPTKGTES